MAAYKKTCDGETQADGDIIYSWSYPKILPLASANVNNVVRRVYAVRDAFSQTQTKNSRLSSIRKWSKMVKAGATLEECRMSGFHKFIVPSIASVRMQKFPNLDISRTRGHSYDCGAIYVAGGPALKILPGERLRHKPDISYMSISIPPVIRPILDPVMRQLTQKIAQTEHELRILEADQKRQILEVRDFVDKSDMSLEICILKKLIFQIQNSLSHRFAATKKKGPISRNRLNASGLCSSFSAARGENHR